MLAASRNFFGRRMNERLEVTDVPVSTVSACLPAIIEQAGPAARFAFEEFFYGRIRNPYTRRAYLHAVRQFSAYCQARGLELPRVTPADVGRHLEALSVALPTRKLHLPALRQFFDELVLPHLVLLNPAHSVRTERYQVLEGKTPEISIADARSLLRSIDVSHVVGFRDRAIIAILIYQAARVGAVARLRCGDRYASGEQDCLRFTEKGGKSREIPVRHDLKGFLLEYVRAAGLSKADAAAPLFRSTIRRTKRLTEADHR